MIGTPTPEQTSFLKSQESKDYVNSFPMKQPREDLQTRYPATDPRGIQLLYRMLEFDPNQRITAAEALKNDWFDDVRLPE